MKKILVTGATGFIGNHVIHELLGKGYTITATSTSEARARTFDWFDQVSYLPLDFKDLSVATDYYNYFGRPELLLHLAWEGLPNYKAAFHIEENLPRHYQFLKNLVSHGLRDMTITGTCFEYGMQEGCLSEDMPSLPANAYAMAKNQLRVQLEELSADMPFSLKWIRLFYMYGKGQSPNSLLSQLQSAIEKGDAVFNMSPGDQLRDYLPVEKVAENIVKIALQTRVIGIINCSSGQPVAVKELVNDYLKDKGTHIELNTGFYPYSELEPKNFWGDTTKLKKALINGQ